MSAWWSSTVLISAWRCVLLALLAARLLGSAGALQIAPEMDTGRELEQVLRDAHIELPSLALSAPDQEVASLRAGTRELMVATQRARIAVARHVSLARHAADESGTAHARRLQEELMRRVEAHFSAQLPPGLRVDKVEWELHRGLAEGVGEAHQPQFVKNTMQPPSELRRGEDETRLRFELRRLHAVLVRIDPISAIQRWRTRRLLAKMSASPDRVAAGLSANPTPWNMDMLRARLSSTTAIRASRAESEAAEAASAAAAHRIENAPAIISDIKLNKPLAPIAETPPKLTETSKLPGWDGTAASRRWARQMRRIGPVDSWDNIPIPGMAR